MHAPNTTARHPTKNTIPDLRLYIHALWRSTKQFLISAILYRGGTEKNLGTWWKLWITTVAVIQKKHHHQKTNIWIHINQLPKSWIIWLPMGARYSTTFTTPFWHLKVAPPKDDKHFYEIIKYANWVIIISKSPNKSCVEDLYNSCEDPNIVKLVSVHSGTDIGIPRFLGIPHFGIPRNLGIYRKISVYHQVT